MQNHFLFYLIFYLSTYGLKSRCFYIKLDANERSNDARLSFTSSFEIKSHFLKKQSSKPTDLFPDKFSVDVSSMTQKEYSIVYFIKLSSESFEYPIANATTYAFSSNNFNKVEIKKSYELYKQENGNGYATLILNEYSNNLADTKKYRMIGTLHSKLNKSLAYDILPVSFTNENTKRTIKYDSFANFHIGKKRSIDLPNLICNVNSLIGEKSEISIPNKSYNSKRAVNKKPVSLNVEILLVTDSSIYLDHQKFAQITDRNLTFEFMKIYYSHFFNGVNQQYLNSLANDTDLRISVKLKNFLFFTNHTDWTNSTKYGVPGFPTSNGREVLQANLVLSAFKTYMNANSFPFSYDMAVAMFDKDIWGGTTLNTSSIVGLSYMSGVCSLNRYLIVEDIGGFGYVTVTSHEIGHNLGAYHDGAASPSGFSQCPASSGNIMTPSASVVNDYNQNFNRFSTCSINAFKQTLLNQNLTNVTSGAQCLINDPIRDNSNPSQLWNANDECKLAFGNNSLYCNYPGQIWSANDQCQMINGNNSYYCVGQIASICTSLWCGTSTNTTCLSVGASSAAEGTACDVGKICIQNKCVSSPSASNRACFINDQYITQPYFSNFQLPSSIMDCESYLRFLYLNIKYNNGLGCSNTYVKNQCCNACNKYQDFKCFDLYSNCGSFLQYCNNPSVTLGGVQVAKACPNTCGKCQPLTCRNSTYVCQNDGTCVNTTLKNNSLIGFTCNCKPGFYGSICELRNGCLLNPCPTNSTCQLVGSLGNYICRLKPVNVTNITTTTTKQNIVKI